MRGYSPASACGSAAAVAGLLAEHEGIFALFFADRLGQLDQLGQLDRYVGDGCNKGTATPAVPLVMGK